VGEDQPPGRFSIRDVRSGSVKRVAAAVGEGAQVVGTLHAYLADAEGEPTTNDERRGGEDAVFADADDLGQGRGRRPGTSGGAFHVATAAAAALAFTAGASPGPSITWLYTRR
jgi:hypothetical protein